MLRQTLRTSCCSTPAAIGFWAALFLVFFGAGLLLRTLWPAAAPYGDTVILVSLAAACFVNYRRNRTLHCGLTAPLFAAGAVVALLIESGAWAISMVALWGMVVVGVLVAFGTEYRATRSRRRCEP
jgi:hypothetical protein